MLISVSGTHCVGKSTFIEDFLKNWSMFKRPTKTYRDVIKDKNLKINKETTKYSQELILDSMIEIMDSYSRKKDYIIFDRTPLDNVMYSLWAYSKGVGDIDEPFIEKCIAKSRKAIQRLDIMFYIPLREKDKIPLVDDGVREVDPDYQKEIDNLFFAAKELRDNGDDKFFNAKDCSPLIEVFGNREERIEIAKLYLKEDGSIYGEEDSLILDALGNPMGVDDDFIIDTGEAETFKKQMGIK